VKFSNFAHVEQNSAKASGSSALEPLAATRPNRNKGKKTNMHISNFTESKFLRKTDVDPPVLVTIGELEQVNVSMPGKPAELKWALHFAELEKPLIMNSTNAGLIKNITGSEDTDHWIGHKIVLYKDDSVSFGGEPVGGIRARAPKKPVAKPAPAPVEVEAPY